MRHAGLYRVILVTRSKSASWLAIAVAIGLVCSSATLAKKPDGPGDEDPPAVEVNPAIAFVTVVRTRQDVVVTGRSMRTGHRNSTSSRRRLPAMSTGTYCPSIRPRS
jgi:hypothetical protein